MRPCLFLLAATVVTSACAPVFNWREVRPENSGAVAMFPCKPDVQARTVDLAGERVRMTLVVCRTGEATFALAFADVSSPAQVSSALASLKTSAAVNISSGQRVEHELRIEGMTPNPQTRRITLQGTGTNGKVVIEEAAFFSKGLRVYQGTVLGNRLEPAVIDNFFDGMKLPS